MVALTRGQVLVMSASASGVHRFVEHSLKGAVCLPCPDSPDTSDLNSLAGETDCGQSQEHIPFLRKLLPEASVSAWASTSACVPLRRGENLCAGVHELGASEPCLEQGQCS